MRKRIYFIIGFMILSMGCVGCNDTGNSHKKVENTDEKKIDYDLTQMGSDMVYATVYQMMTAPAEFEGKMIKMHGTYDTSYIEEKKNRYHFVIIKDAMACCAQGLEFTWNDGEHQKLEECPQKGEELTVTGEFETYKEEGDSNQYCRLKNAEVKKEKQ